MSYFATHAGKGVLFVFGAALLLAWPPALPWVSAVILLQFGVRHFILAFKEADRALSTYCHASANQQSLPAASDRDGMVTNHRDRSLRARSSVD